MIYINGCPVFDVPQNKIVLTDTMALDKSILGSFNHLKPETDKLVYVDIANPDYDPTFTPEEGVDDPLQRDKEFIFERWMYLRSVLVTGMYEFEFEKWYEQFDSSEKKIVDNKPVLFELNESKAVFYLRSILKPYNMINFMELLNTYALNPSFQFNYEKFLDHFSYDSNSVYSWETLEEAFSIPDYGVKFDTTTYPEHYPHTPPLHCPFVHWTVAEALDFIRFSFSSRILEEAVVKPEFENRTTAAFQENKDIVDTVLEENDYVSRVFFKNRNKVERPYQHPLTTKIIFPSQQTLEYQHDVIDNKTIGFPRISSLKHSSDNTTTVLSPNTFNCPLYPTYIPHSGISGQFFTDEDDLKFATDFIRANVDNADLFYEIKTAKIDNIILDKWEWSRIEIQSRSTMIEHYPFPENTLRSIPYNALYDVRFTDIRITGVVKSVTSNMFIAEHVIDLTNQIVFDHDVAIPWVISPTAVGQKFGATITNGVFSMDGVLTAFPQLPPDPDPNLPVLYNGERVTKIIHDVDPSTILTIQQQELNFFDPTEFNSILNYQIDSISLTKAQLLREYFVIKSALVTSNINGHQTMPKTIDYTFKLIESKESIEDVLLQQIALDSSDPKRLPLFKHLDDVDLELKSDYIVKLAEAIWDELNTIVVSIPISTDPSMIGFMNSQQLDAINQSIGHRSVESEFSDNIFYCAYTGVVANPTNTNPFTIFHDPQPDQLALSQLNQVLNDMTSLVNSRKVFVQLELRKKVLKHLLKINWTVTIVTEPYDPDAEAFL